MSDGDWTLEPASGADSGWTLEPAQHGDLAEYAHKAASYLPAAGGFAGGIVGGMGGAAVGAPSGPGAIATTAAGAGVGAAMGGAAGKGLQHVIDTALGYEQPIANAGDLGDRVADMGRSGLEEGATNAIGTGVAGVAMPFVAKGARALAAPIRTAANKMAARLPAGTAGSYAQMLQQDPESFEKLGKLLLDRGTVNWSNLAPNAVAKRIPELAEQTGKEVGDAIAALDASGARVPKGDAINKIFNLSRDEAGVPVAASERLRDKYLNQVQRMLDEIESTGKFDQSFAEAENLKRKAYDPVVFSLRNPTTAQAGDSEIAKAILQANDAAASKANPQLAQNFFDAKEASGLAQKAADMALPAQGRAEARGLIGPTARMGGYIGLVESAAHGSPVGMASSVAAPVIAQAAKTRTPGAVAMGLKSTSDLLKNLATTRPQMLGPYAGVLLGAMRDGGDDGFHASSYVLSQTDPGFQALTKQLAESQH